MKKVSSRDWINYLLCNAPPGKKLSLREVSGPSRSLGPQWGSENYFAVGFGLIAICFHVERKILATADILCNRILRKNEKQSKNC